MASVVHSQKRTFRQCEFVLSVPHTYGLHALIITKDEIFVHSICVAQYRVIIQKNASQYQ